MRTLAAALCLLLAACSSTPEPAPTPTPAPAPPPAPRATAQAIPDFTVLEVIGDKDGLRVTIMLYGKERSVQIFPRLPSKCLVMVHVGEVLPEDCR